MEKDTENRQLQKVTTDETETETVWIYLLNERQFEYQTVNFWYYSGTKHRGMDDITDRSTSSLQMQSYFA